MAATRRKQAPALACTHQVKLSRRPAGCPVGDEPAFRQWYAQRLLAQMATDADALALDKLEHSLLVLLRAVHSWHDGAPTFED